VRMAGDQTNVSAQAVPKTKYNIRQNRVWCKIKLLLEDEAVEGVTTAGNHTPPRKVKYDDGSHRHDLLERKRQFIVMSLNLHACNCRLLIWEKVRCHVFDARRVKVQTTPSHLIYQPQISVDCVLHFLHTSVYARSTPNNAMSNTFLNILHSAYKTAVPCMFLKCLICERYVILRIKFLYASLNTA
jgi:hypothetical protein